LVDNLFHFCRYRLEISSPTTVNGVDTLPDHIAMPVGAIRAGWRLRSLDRDDSGLNGPIRRTVRSSSDSTAGRSVAHTGVAISPELVSTAKTLGETVSPFIWTEKVTGIPS
jgi:hypothetical protein